MGFVGLCVASRGDPPVDALSHAMHATRKILQNRDPMLAGNDSVWNESFAFDISMWSLSTTKKPLATAWFGAKLLGGLEGVG